MGEEHLQFYKDWERRHNERQIRLNEMMHGYKDDLQIVKDGLKEENDLANRILEEERLLTEQMIKEMLKKMNVKEEEILVPIKDQISELKKKLNFLRGDVNQHMNVLNKKGLKITLHFLENILQINPIKAYVTLWRNDQIDFDVNCNVTKYKTQNIEDFMNSKKIRQKIKQKENFDIEIEEEFFIFKHYKPDLKDPEVTITLEIAIYEINGSATFENKEQKQYLDSYLVQNDEQLIGKTFLVLKYINNSINVGRYKYTLYEDFKDQQPPFKKNKFEKTEQKISFTVEEFQFDEQDQQQIFFRNKRPRKKKEDKLIGEKKPFILNHEIPIRKIFENGSGIDIYIDNARYMPNSITVSKIVLRIVDQSLKDIIKPYTKLCDIHSNIYNPIFEMKKELRQPFYDPTSILLITLLTIDEREVDVDKQCKIMGYSFFPLFLSKQNLEQPESRFEENYYLNEGLYQIPIFCEDYYQEKPFLYKNQLNLDRISCSSLLIRVLFAPKEKDTAKVLSSKDYPKEQWEKLGILIPAPDYQSGKYITSYFNVTDQELQLFQYFKLRQSIYALDKAISIGLQKKTFQHILDKGLDNDQLLLEVKNLMNDLLDHEKSQELLEQKYNNKYDQKIGFKFCIDGFHNLQKDVFPPASLYTQNPEPLTIHINTLFDWNSPLRSPKFLEGYTLFQNVPLDRNACMIIDIRQVKFKKNKIKIKEYAWTITPLFTTDGFVNSGVFQIPIFQGTVQKKILKELSVSRNPWETLKTLSNQTDENNRKKKIINFLNYSSVIVRLVDASRSGHLKKSFDYRRIKYTYIPEDLNYQYAYNDIVQQNLLSKPQLNQVVPKTMNCFQANKKVTDAVINLLELQQYVNLQSL